jgi:prevent-host-death family protein
VDSQRLGINPIGEGKYQVELLGLDVFDPIIMKLDSESGKNVPAWFLDNNYNGLLSVTKMETIDINKALPQINQLLEKAATGEEIIITRNNQPMVKLVSTQAAPKRPPLFGSDKNIISISDDFDEPLEDFKDYM